MHVWKWSKDYVGEPYLIADDSGGNQRIISGHHLKRGKEKS